MKEEKKYTITVTEHQLALISQCVEDCHRFAAGQTDLWNTLSSFMHSNDLHEVQAMLEELKQLITPAITDFRASYGWSGGNCPNKDQREFIAETYCIYREILHRMRVINRKDDGSYSCYDSETLTCDEGGTLPIIELVKEESK